MSLTHDDLEDIKQLMEAVVYQHGRVLKDEITQEIMQEMDKRFDEQNEKLDEIMNAVGEDLAKHSAKLDDHDERLTRLERKAT